MTLRDIDTPIFTEEQRAAFHRDGFLLVEDFITPQECEAALARYAPLFRGEFETGLIPDEWNWREGRDPKDVTRQICNGWKADRTIARVVLQPKIGRACAELMDWPGARINQDNVLWKPPRGKALGFHQDDSYQDWIEPRSLCTCWMPLEPTTAEGGTMSYVRGSHRWDLSDKIAQFHAPEDFTADLRRAAAEAGAPEPVFVPVVLPRGGAAFHHGRTWHGSAPNTTDRPRRSLVAHCMRSDARFAEEGGVSPVYSRYRRQDTDDMDEAFFPILWTRDGYRSPWLRHALGTADALS